MMDTSILHISANCYKRTMIYSILYFFKQICLICLMKIFNPLNYVCSGAFNTITDIGLYRTCIYDFMDVTYRSKQNFKNTKAFCKMRPRSMHHKYEINELLTSTPYSLVCRFKYSHFRHKFFLTDHLLSVDSR